MQGNRISSVVIKGVRRRRMEKTDDPAAVGLGITSGSAQGPYPDLAIHSLGWKAFQDLCA